MSRVIKRLDAAGGQTKAPKSLWPTRALGDVCDVIGGGTPSKEIASYYGGAIPWATVRDMRADLIENTECSITTDAVQASATNIIPAGNVIIATRVGLGKVCILGQDTAINQDLRGIIPRNGNVKVKFLYHWLRYIAPRIVAEGSGATVQGVKLPFIKSLQMPIPTIPEQDRIVAILDEAFEGIAEAATNATRALHKAQTLFESCLQSVVNQHRPGWQQRSLAEISREYGRGKSKHRPRNDPRLYEGPYPFVQTGDISNASHWLTSYKQTYSEVGLAQSRLWPKGTVCIAIVGATVGETAILNFAACFPDSVIGIVVDERIADNEYVEYLLQASKSLLKEKGKGTARDNINLGTFENHEFSFPPLNQQKEIVSTINALSKQIGFLSSVCQKRIRALEELKQSLLNQAFSGQLLNQTAQAIVIPFPITLPSISSTDIHVGILSIAFAAHEKAHKASDFGHVKAEKIAHMVEAFVGVDLGRTPVRDAAGPNDFPHLKKVEHRADKAGYLTFARQPSGAYRVTKKAGFDSLVTKTRAALGNRNHDLDKLLNLMTPMTTKQAEIFATVYAAWNNLLMDGEPITDERIVRAAREDWHSDKLNIPRDKFFTAIEWIRTKGLCPEGKGKRVEAKKH